MASMIGAAFRKDPELIVPPELEYINDDVDGGGVSIYQQSQKTTESVLGVGRCLLLVDYPKTEGVQTRAQMSALNIRPSILRIDARRVVNWRSEMVGGKNVLSLIVYRDDQQEETEDGFGVDLVEQFRVLRLIDGAYIVQLWRKFKDEWVVYDEYPVFDGAGNQMREIPAVFAGSCNNDPAIDNAPFLPIAELNIAHFRNSADYEESAYFTGQKQYWMSGADENWLEMAKKEGVYIGCRQLFPVPSGETLGLIEAASDGILKEAKDDKIREMVSLGARLMQEGSAVKTATEAQSENEAQHSVLSLAVENVSDAYTKCLGWMLEFLNVSGEVEYQISQEFTRARIDAQMMGSHIAAYNALLLSKQDVWRAWERGGIIKEMPDDEREELIEASAQAAPAMPAFGV
jgi:hypothetical protein